MMDILDTPRQFPQFGKHLSSLVRPRSEVFRGKGKGSCGCGGGKGAFGRGGAGYKSLCGCASGNGTCGHSGGDYPPFPLMQQSAGNLDAASIAIAAATAGGGCLCCVGISCYIPVSGNAVHCQFYVEQCDGRSFILELHPHTVVNKPPTQWNGADSILTLKEVTGMPTPPLDVIECEECDSCFPREDIDDPQCGLVACILEQAKSYPLGKATAKDIDVGKKLHELMDKRMIGEYTRMLAANLGIAYIATGPNSNTFVGHVGRECGMKVPGSNAGELLPTPPVNGKPQAKRTAPGISFSAERLEEYLETREEWLSK